MVCDELVKHLQGNLWLVHGDHVAGLEDLHEVEAIGGPQLADRLAIHVVVRIPSLVELILVRPLHRQCPLLVTKPVANVVNIPCIYQDFDAIRQHVWEHLLVCLHPVALECHVDDAVATFPLLACSQFLLHVGRVQEPIHLTHVVAKGRNCTLDAHVIWVIACKLVWDELTIVTYGIGSAARAAVCPAVARLDEAHTWICCRPHSSLSQGASDHTVLQCTTLRLSSILGHVWVPLVLLLGVNKAITNANALQRHLEAS
mmetsp:Transcript_58488/g.107954  ORF Transcript_58488/g.107954 Transcript_58488/m.107954 type:complete len:258 (+) Transcript_58488:162-935(+)